ncbi:MAG: VWA domain-containing protein [Lentisphaeria bacterium]|nr:VWA domain-containing protein [Lentisphaeria bacterium]
MNKKFAILACLLSLAVHLLLYVMASRVSFNGAGLDALKKTNVTPEEYQASHVANPPERQEDDDPLKPKWEDGSTFEVPEFEDLDKENPLDIQALDPSEELFRQQQETSRKILDEHTPTEAPVDVYQLNGASEQPPTLATPVPMNLPEEALVVTAPRPEILEIKANDIAPERLTDVRFMHPDLEREFVPSEVELPSLAAVGALSGPPPVANISEVKLQAQRPSFGISESDLEGLYGSDSLLPDARDIIDGRLPAVDGQDPLGKVTLPKGILENVLPLDDYVTVQVSTYPDPAGPGGTFLVEIRPGPKSNSMPDIPKDVLFILDRSSSISLPKFNQFKVAVKEVLQALDDSDRFNVISFNDRQSAIFTQFVSGSRANIATATETIDKLPHGGRTDVFGGVAPFVKQSNGNRKRPLNIFLLTDGQSTVNIYEPSQFLRQISGINPGNVSIFPFSAEKKANRMLLDFLGYLNKGEKCHVESTDEIRDAMVRFYSEHANLIVTNIRCAATNGANVNEIFPRSLPHLYRNQTLRLFGRYENKADTLTLSITGRDADGTLRDLVFRRKLDQCPQGAPTLPAQWAGQKILFLLSKLNLSDNPAERASLTERIDTLKKQYSILSPY